MRNYLNKLLVATIFYLLALGLAGFSCSKKYKTSASTDLKLPIEKADKQDEKKPLEKADKQDEKNPLEKVTDLAGNIGEISIGVVGGCIGGGIGAVAGGISAACEGAPISEAIADGAADGARLGSSIAAPIGKCTAQVATSVLIRTPV
ncbi:Hypothetical protein CHV_a0159 [Cardinium endosymbiont cBtQ1 of Bemisia tabaci]|nr:Hypothetical protein CHV_a0159 [Cardinium endosymbiont cBtQ1 of Bemisia tabaci]